MTFATRSVINIGAVLVATSSLFAQNDARQERVAGVKPSIADDQRLRQYQWIETTELTWNGDARPPSQQLCRFGPDGQIKKIPIGPAREPLGETRETQEYLGDVEALIGTYALPEPNELERAYRARTVSLNPTGSVVSVVFKDYVRSGDQMTIAFDTAARKVVSVNIDTHIGPDKDAVTFRALIASLPDGTNYVRQTVLTAGGTRLAATTTRARYRILGLATPEQRSN
jgi:hypothetical protein